MIGAPSTLGASITVAGRPPDPGTRVGRYLREGIPANARLSVIKILIPWIPLRRGEMWAPGASLNSLLMNGVPVFALDAFHVSPKDLFATLIRQS